MNISLNTTHRLPFFNATVTAKQLSDSTTPVQFYTFTGESIGLTVRTNARGYICRTDGTPYTDGVFVKENAIITATLGDGSYTSWTVGADNEIIIFDGILYGRELKDGEQDPNAVIIGTKRYKKLFSANQEPNSQLSLDDLANVPNFTKWTEDQQIEVIDFSNLNKQQVVTMGIQTKTVILLPKSGTSIESPTVFNVILQATLDEQNESRFGRNFTIMNLTPHRVVLKNAQFGQYAAGAVNAYCAVTVTELYPNAEPDSKIGGEAYFKVVDNGELSSEAYGNVDTDSYSKISITDASPDIVTIKSVYDTSLNYSEVFVDTSSISITRRVIIRRLDEYPGTVVLKSPAGIIGYLMPLGSIEVIVSSGGYCWPVDTNNIKIKSCLTELTDNASNPASCGPDCTVLTVDCSNISSQTSLHRLLFYNSDREFTRVEFLNAPNSIWITLCTKVNGLIYDWNNFSIPQGNSRVLVRNIGGILKVIDKSWTCWNSIVYEKGGHWEIKANTLDIQLDIGEINSITDKVWGTYYSGDNDLDITLPIKENSQALIRFDVSDYFTIGHSSYINIFGSNGKMCVKHSEGDKLFLGWCNSIIGANAPVVKLSSQYFNVKITSSSVDMENNYTERNILQKTMK